MPYIYKITNMITGKAYVGKTMHSVEKRWKEHCREYRKQHREIRPLYNAMNQYGIKNFNIETIEECSAEDASTREMYWIQYFNTYKDGYNATLGGDSKHHIDYDTVIEVFCLTENQQITAELLSIDVSSVHNILCQFGLSSTETNPHLHRRNAIPVSMHAMDGTYIRSFDSAIAALRYVAPHYTKQHSGSHIIEVCKGIRNTAYGYKWEFMISEDTNDIGN